MLERIVWMLAACLALLAGIATGGVLVQNGVVNQPFVPAMHNPSPSPSFVLHVGEAK